MLIKSFVAIFFSLSVLCFADGPLLDHNSQVVAYTDLKGNGLKEKVILNGSPYNNLGDYYFKSLKIFEDVRLVYEFDSGDGFDEVTVDHYVVAPLRNSRKSQILILLRGSDAVESNLKIIEWDGQKYVETLNEHCRTADVQDLEKKGEFQMILGQRDQIPHIYDYDSHLGGYAVSDQKHLSFFKKLIKEYESDLAEDYQDSTRLVKLKKIADAAKLVGDIAKEKDARHRLSELRDKMAQNNSSSKDSIEQTKQ